MICISPAEIRSEGTAPLFRKTFHAGTPLAGREFQRSKEATSQKEERKKKKGAQTERRSPRWSGHDLWIGWAAELFHTGSIPVPYGIRVGWAKWDIYCPN